jgi:formyl-CoA transferase
MTGMYATVAILGALNERHVSGRGQHIDMSLLDTQIGWLANHGLNFLVSGENAKRWGNAHPNLCPYQSFDASDGAMIVAVGNDRQFRSLCRVLEMEAIASLPEFSSNSARLANRERLVEQIQHALCRAPRERWLAQLEAAGVPAGPINSVAQALADPHVVSRGMTFSLPHAIGSDVPQIANPIKFSRSPIEYDRPPPALGEHTDEVLTWLGFSSTTIASLKEAGVIESSRIGVPVTD